jgi:hypothetical protein
LVIQTQFPGTDIMSVEPIDLSTHPLHGLDLDTTSRRELMEKAGLDGVGEFKRALHTLMEKEDMYIKKPISSARTTNDLAAYIKSYLMPSTSPPCPPL